MDFLSGTTHLHITTWVIGLVLFFICALAAKPNKGVHMALRAMYLLIIASGVILFIGNETIEALVDNGDGMVFHVKMLLGFIVIAAMEMVLVAKKKGKKTTVANIVFAVALIAVIFVGLGGIGQTIGLNLF